MARRKIIWSTQAKNDRIKILKFWQKHNESAFYSRKLNVLFIEAVIFISEFPTVGRLTQDKHARIKIVRDYLIIYEIRDSVIIILAIFDSRRNPLSLNR